LTAQRPETPDTSTKPTDSAATQKARMSLGIIVLLFMLPLVLMLVTSIVCIAVVLAKR
jgi:flagellar biosynthesis protein FliP